MDTIDFPMNRRNYDLLRVETQTPRLLVVLHLPRNEEQWVTIFGRGACDATLGVLAEPQELRRNRQPIIRYGAYSDGETSSTSTTSER